MSALIGWVVIILGVLIVIGWVWNKWGNKTTAVGQAVSKAVDTADAYAAYASLTGIRMLDSVESDPKAVEACDYLRNVVTAWKRPLPVPVATVTTTTTDTAATPKVTISVNGKTIEV